MRKHRFAVSLTFLAFLLCLVFAFGTVALAAQPADVDNHWAAGEIAKAMGKGYVKGYPDGTFKPNQAVTRAEFVTMVNGAFAVAEAGNALNFSDVKEEDWFYKNAAAAVAAGYVKGYPDGTFRPNQGITRQEAAVVLYGLVGSGDKADLTFKDAGQIGSWARDAVARLVAGKVITGYPDNTFGPARSITRAEAVVMINKALSLKEGQQAVTPGEPTDLKLTPDMQQKYLEETVTLTATLTDKDGHAVPGKSVAFQVKRGDKIVLDKAVATDNDGKAVFQYKGPAEPATDTIQAKLGNLSATATVEWVRKSGGGGGGSGGGITTITVTSTSNPFSVASTYNHNYVFNSGAEDGTYGPAGDKAIITSDVTVNVPGITLKNLVIKGNLVAGAGIGDGDLTLDSVIVEGKSNFNGGGADSIKLQGETELRGTVTINKAGLRLLVTDSAWVTGNVVLEQPATLEASEESAFSGDVLVDISRSADEGTVNIKAPIHNIIVQTAPENATIVVGEGIAIGIIEIKAAGITIENNGTIETVKAGEGTVVKGNLPAKVVGGSEATFAATNEIGVHEGKVYEEYRLEVGDEIIDLSEDNVSKITVLEPGANEPKELTPNSDTTLWFNVQKPSGDYVFTVVDKNGKVYTATLNWPAPTMVTAEPAGKEGYNEDLEAYYFAYQFKDGETRIDLDSFEKMYQIKPNGEIFELQAVAGDPYLWFKATDQIEGTHTFLVKKDGSWYKAVIDWETRKPTVTLNVPETIGTNRQGDISSSTSNPFGGVAYSNVRFNITLAGPTAFTEGTGRESIFTITKVNGNDNTQGINETFQLRDGKFVGYWGPVDGFPMGVPYEASSTFSVVMGEGAPTGDYTIIVELVDLSNNQVLAEASATFTVSD